jgi:hypothetical protein
MDEPNLPAKAGSIQRYTGSTLVDLLGESVQQNRQAWEEAIDSAVAELQEKGLTLDDLKSNPAFQETLMKATRIAIASASTEKRQALRAAAINAALPTAPDQSQLELLVSLVDSLTEWHIRLLKLFDSPVKHFQELGKRWPDFSMGGMSGVLERAYPELAGRREFYDPVWRDLYARGLVNTEHLHTTMTGHGLTQQRTTELGRKFVQFITDPL